MQKWKIALISVGVLLTGTIAYFWQDINEIRALQKYASLFDAETIDENFRSVHKQYPAVNVKRGEGIYELPFALKEGILPKTYDYEGEDRNLKDFFKNVQTTGLIVMQDGNVIFEEYDRGNTKDDLVISMSVTKSMTSTLIGIAREEGLFKLDDQVIKYAPKLKGTPYEGVTIKNALEMSSGVSWNEDYGDLNSDIVRSTVAMLLGAMDDFPQTMTRANEPGTYNHYASIDTHVLGMVLRGATGKSYEDYFHEKLWSKLGAESDVEISIDSVGQPLVYTGVNVRLRDMLRFGKLFLDDGRNYLGEQIVPASWVKEATKPDAPHLMAMVNNPASGSGFGYKYQWWIPLTPDHNDYSAIGIYGQFVYVNPKRKIVIAKTSAYANYTKDGGMMNYETLLAFQAIAKHLSPDEKE